MKILPEHKKQILELGYTTVEGVYTAGEIGKILEAISRADTSKETFRKSTEVFAIRQFLKEVPASFELIFTENLKKMIRQVIGGDVFVTKSIYFDKPEMSNWYVSYHQDLTISVDKKTELEDFGPWTTKQNQYAVQPPVSFLEKITTIRIHLDDTNEYNGALKVLPRSHLKKIYRPDTIDWTKEREITCPVRQGGVMLMKPLLMHSSARTTNGKKRRVIHIELSDMDLPAGLGWSEHLKFN